MPERLLDKVTKDELDAAMGRVLRHAGRRDDDGSWLVDETDCWSQTEIDSLIDLELLQEWRNQETPSRESLETLIYQKCENDCSSQEFSELVRYANETAVRVIEGNPNLDSDDEYDLREEILDDFMSTGRLRVDIVDAGDMISRRSDVLVDVILNDNEEWNHDYVNVNVLAYAQADPDEVTPDTLEQTLGNNGLSLLAEKLGLARNVMLTARDKADEGHDLYEELESTSCYGSPVMCVFVRVPFEEYVQAVEGHGPLELRPQGKGGWLLAGLFDPWNGAGGQLGISIERPIRLEREQIADLAVEAMGSKRLVSRFYGYPMSEVYGTDETPWHRGHLSPVQDAK